MTRQAVLLRTTVCRCVGDKPYSLDRRRYAASRPARTGSLQRQSPAAPSAHSRPNNGRGWFHGLWMQSTCGLMFRTPNGSHPAALPESIPLAPRSLNEPETQSQLNSILISTPAMSSWTGAQVGRAPACDLCCSGVAVPAADRRVTIARATRRSGPSARTSRAACLPAPRNFEPTGLWCGRRRSLT